MIKIKSKSSEIEADTASTFWKKMIGLSFSRKKNMLFIMEYEDRWFFWMFLVRYPLKMIFIDKNKTVIDIKEAKPLSLDIETWRGYSSEQPCKYVLETPFNLKMRIGDKLDW
jgi:uncharacterized membrane protein (UPF0127 family)